MHLLHFSSYESDLVWHRGASLLYQDDNFQQQYERHSFPSKNLIKMNKFENLLHCVNFMFAQDFLTRAFKYQRIEKRRTSCDRKNSINFGDQNFINFENTG